jgi:hypothetical protein
MAKALACQGFYCPQLKLGVRLKILKSALAIKFSIIH